MTSSAIIPLNLVLSWSIALGSDIYVNENFPAGAYTIVSK